MQVGLSIVTFYHQKTNLDLPGLLTMCKDGAGLNLKRLSERIVHTY